MLSVPILYVVFNRLDTVKKTFPVIKQQKPLKLYIAADGPRKNKTGEDVECTDVRNWILSQIDWNCDVHTLFREENLGCKYGVSKAIQWFFQNEEKGIVMEDDILATNSFFQYCEKMLDWYQNDETIGFISGCTLSKYVEKKSEDYFLSTIPGVWGWASWNKKIKNYNPDYASLLNNKKVTTIMLNKRAEKNLLNNSLKSAKGEIDTWDYQMSDYMVSNKMYTIYPKMNLIRNCGFEGKSTHTFGIPSWYKDVSYEFNFIKLDTIKLNKKYAKGYESTHVISFFTVIKISIRSFFKHFRICRFLYYKVIKKN